MKPSIPHAFQPEEIMAYLDGELEAQQAAALASHLEHCSECGVLAIRLRQISERMLDFQVEPNAATLEAPIFAALDSEPATTSSKLPLHAEPNRRPLLRGFAWAGVAIAALLVIGALSIATLEKRAATSRMEDVAYLMSSRGVSVQASVTPGPPPPAPRPAARPMGKEFSGQVVTERQIRLPAAQASEEGAIEAPELHGPMIVQTASLTILATNYDQASGAIPRVTAQHIGYIQDMTADTRTGAARSVSATLRVPDKQLEAFLADLRKLGHVEQETRNNQEITDQYIDLTARLRTARASERRIIDLLGNRTGKLSDVLDAERELARIRGEIESMNGQRANMEHQVSYATVQVQLNEEYREELNAQTYSTGTRVRNSLVAGFRNLGAGVMALVIFLFSFGPSILFWVALFGVPAWFVWRHYRRSKVA